MNVLSNNFLFFCAATLLTQFISANNLSSGTDLKVAHITSKRDPINPTIKKQVTQIITKRPEALSIDESLFTIYKKPTTLNGATSSDSLPLTEPLSPTSSSNSHVSTPTDSPRFTEFPQEHTDEQLLYNHEHFAAETLSDLIDETINELKKKETGSHVYNKEHTFNVISQMFNTSLSYKDFLKARRKIPVINYLQECDCLYRRYFSFRKDTEKRILKHIETLKLDPKKELIITEFASGDVLEIFIVANLLIEKGYRNLRLNCLDLRYHNLLQRYKNTYRSGTQPLSKDTLISQFTISEAFPWQIIKKTNKEDQLFNFNELAYMSKIINNANSLKILDKNSEDFETHLSDRQQNLEYLFKINEDYQLHKTLYQTVRWFNDDPKNKVKLVLYSDAQVYIDECVSDPSQKSDIILAIDYYPDINFDWWNTLREYALKDNGLAITVIDKLQLEDGRDDIFFLSEGTPTTLFHYEFEEVSPEDAKKAVHKMHRIKAIPGFKITDSLLNETTGEYESIEKIRKPIPEVTGYLQAKL